MSKCTPEDECDRCHYGYGITPKCLMSDEQILDWICLEADRAEADEFYAWQVERQKDQAPA